MTMFYTFNEGPIQSVGLTDGDALDVDAADVQEFIEQFGVPFDTRVSSS